MCLSALGLCESAQVGGGEREGEGISVMERKQEKESERASKQKRGGG